MRVVLGVGFTLPAYSREDCATSPPSPTPPACRFGVYGVGFGIVGSGFAVQVQVQGFCPTSASSRSPPAEDVRVQGVACRV